MIRYARRDTVPPSTTAPSGGRALLVRLLVLALLTATLSTSGVLPTAQAHAGCTVPISVTIRGKLADLDQCYDRPFTHNGTSYRIHAYYTEQNTTANTNRCTSAEGTARCEHALSDTDDANGDNTRVVAMATEAEAALRFYIDRNLNPLGTGTELNVYVAEDPRTGGVIYPDSIYIDDDTIDNNDQLWKRLLAFHEQMHLVQDKFDNGGVGWQAWYGEGIARAIEDRVDNALDADTGHLFVPEANGHLGSDAERTGDFLTQSYRTVLWWTWLLDTYRAGGDTEPAHGWAALRAFYDELNADNDQLNATRDFIAGRGGSFARDWIDYALALYAYKYNPSDARLRFRDAEISGPATTGLSGHTVLTGGPAFATVTPTMSPRSSRYFEFNPASQCDYTAFTFDGNGSEYGFSVMTVDGGNLASRATSRSTTWARTVRTAGLDRAVGVVTSVDSSGPVDVGRGCVTPTINIKRPTTAAYATVGRANNPRKFLVRLDVDGRDGSPVSGLTAGDFTVRVRRSSGGGFFDATVVSAAYVQDDYWLLVQAPNGAAGASTGDFHDLRVRLGTATDTEPGSLLYVERQSDSVIVLDRSGSMAADDKITAARNAASLFANELAGGDQGGFVAFDHDASLRRQLASMTAANRAALQAAIAAETPGGATSIGDGMRVAAAEEDTRGRAGKPCSFVLLSDGHENAADLWSTVRPGVVDNQCAMHVIGLGSGANESLLQQIAASVPGVGGSYDYADVTTGVPAGTGAATGPGATAAGALSWQNNLGRIYDYKATQAAGRQRIFSASGPTDGSAGDGTATFDDLRLHTRLGVGGELRSGDVPLTGRLFSTPDGQLVDGSARVDDAGLAGGSGQDLAVNNLTVEFGLEADRGASLKFADLGGSVNLEVDGDLRAVEDFAELDGSAVGGAKVSVTDLGDGRGVVRLSGRVDRLAVGGQELWVDDVQGDRGKTAPHTFTVDRTADMLVVSVSWQRPSGGQQVRLIDPDGNPLPTSLRRPGPDGTNEVWEVPRPQPGRYRLQVDGLDQQYYAAASTRTHYELQLFTGTPVRSLRQGVAVPIVAMLAGKGVPLPGARVTAVVTDPQGGRRNVRLSDDGNSDDGAARDGVYAGTYTSTNSAELVADGTDVVDGQEPAVVGSYLVDATAVRGRIRREAQASFVVDAAPDRDGDGLPDGWERTHGLDPRDKGDGRGDSDRDGLSNRCELRLGTRPDNSDTDAGGEADGSELGRGVDGCVVVGNDPLDRRDDRVGPLVAAVGSAEATPQGRPFVSLVLGNPTDGRLRSVDIRRRVVKGREVVSDWRLVAEGVDGREYVDRDVSDGLTYAYEVTPTVVDADGRARTGRVLRSNRITAASDPYAPSGSVLVNGGAKATRRRLVTLSIAADDVSPAEDGDPGELRPGTPATQLRMRISNTPRFRGEFRPFRPTVRRWKLAKVPRGATAAVYVQFADAAGNVGSAGFGQVDTIVYRPRR